MISWSIRSRTRSELPNPEVPASAYSRAGFSSPGVIDRAFSSPLGLFWVSSGSPLFDMENGAGKTSRALSRGARTPLRKRRLFLYFATRPPISAQPNLCQWYFCCVSVRTADNQLCNLSISGDRPLSCIRFAGSGPGWIAYFVLFCRTIRIRTAPEARLWKVDSIRLDRIGCR